MTGPSLTILDGGKSLSVSEMHRVFLESYVTDTRLMGVLAICARWEIISPTADRDDPDSWEELSQFIYIDCEEAGFETYQQIRGNDDPEADRIEEALICGLGGNKVDLNERQLRLLVQNWYRFNQSLALPDPPGWRDYSFLLEPEIKADPREQYDLMQMICAPIKSDEQVVNYFLMRCFGRDYEGARYLTDAGDPANAGQAEADSSNAGQAAADSAYGPEPGCLLSDRVIRPIPSGPNFDLPDGRPLHAPFRLDLYDDCECATFCRNIIDVHGTYVDGATRYECESLIEMDGDYEEIVSLVTVRNRKVVGFEHGSRFPISDVEAAMILKKPEYITLYEVFLSEDELEDNLDEFTLGFHTTMSEYENGLLFMSFRPTNDHVDSRRFQLSNDVRGMYFLTNHGQLLLCSHNAYDLHELETTLSSSVLAPYFIPSGHFKFVPGAGYSPDTGHYEFREPILYEFMNSDFEHFEDFLQMITPD